MKRWLILVMGLLMLAGCGSAPAATEEPAAPAASQAPVPSWPAAVALPSVGAESDLIPVGILPDGRMETPSVYEPGQAAWYEHSVLPGEIGPTIIVGHVDGNGGQPGVFYDLAELAIGDPVLVAADNGRVFEYEVTNVERYPKADFPTDLVYGNTDVPTIRLITCGGAFGNATPGHYDDNVVAFGVLRSN